MPNAVEVGAHLGGVGPDGRGPDRLIDSVETLELCMLEIVSQLSAIETFRWPTPVLPMPASVFEELRGLTALIALHLDLPSARASVSCSVPYWQLTDSLQDLSITIDCSHCRPISAEELEELGAEKIKKLKAIRGRSGPKRP